ncbi:MAG: RrF2 family transcriptional regulator [Firmicutes bacterium]|nr:RrF2 family transcriptional regulator [Bacillota bacterium]MBR2593234.1 RrF2 family transcriptional regulator [Bacillota bacterium]
MRVSTKGRYALRVMIDLAQNQDEGCVPLKGIAERQDVSVKYLEAIVSILNKAGLVVSYRGKEGGYKLSRAPEKYTVNEILTLTEGSLAPVVCLENSDGSRCERAYSCITLPMWRKLDEVINDYLGNITLQDLIDGNV